MNLHLALNLFNFLPALGDLYDLQRAPNFYIIHPRSEMKVR
jgi:hypothetical protein